jgi:hypothetical protein
MSEPTPEEEGVQAAEQSVEGQQADAEEEDPGGNAPHHGEEESVEET